MDSLKMILKDKGIHFKHVIVKEGDMVHIPPGMYHYIENNTVNDYTIMLNIDYDINNNDYEKIWDSMWKNAEWIK
jgi:oxalate decarboxylase/phosphoglucose isomerase-like protein (cupin superfamily)